MEDLTREVFRVALLDAQNALLRDVIVSEGTLSGRRGQFPAPRVRAGRGRGPPGSVLVIEDPVRRRSHA
jgi:hypothetical protein